MLYEKLLLKQELQLFDIIHQEQGHRLQAEVQLGHIHAERI